MDGLDVSVSPIQRLTECDVQALADRLFSRGISVLPIDQREACVEARAVAADVLRINPGFTIETSKRILVFKDPKDLGHHIDGMRKARLPAS